MKDRWTGAPVVVPRSRRSGPNALQDADHDPGGSVAAVAFQVQPSLKVWLTDSMTCRNKYAGVSLRAEPTCPGAVLPVAAGALDACHAAAHDRRRWCIAQPGRGCVSPGRSGGG